MSASNTALTCPVCGAVLVFRRHRWNCPRCDYWKESYGEADWRRHSQNVSTLLKELRLRFPQVTWTTGLGAQTAERLDIPPDRKGEPDIKGWWMRKHFVSIEVSGTDSPNVEVPPDDIHIRPDKIAEAQSSQVPSFFYMVYRNSAVTVSLATAVKFKATQIRKQIKGKTEVYSSIPASQAMTGTSFGEAIRDLLHKMDPRIALEETSIADTF